MVKGLPLKQEDRVLGTQSPGKYPEGVAVTSLFQSQKTEEGIPTS